MHVKKITSDLNTADQVGWIQRRKADVHTHSYWWQAQHRVLGVSNDIVCYLSRYTSRRWGEKWRMCQKEEGGVRRKNLSRTQKQPYVKYAVCFQGTVYQDRAHLHNCLTKNYLQSVFSFTSYPLYIREANLFYSAQSRGNVSRVCHDA